MDAQKWSDFLRKLSILSCEISLVLSGIVSRHIYLSILSCEIRRAPPALYPLKSPWTFNSLLRDQLPMNLEKPTVRKLIFQFSLARSGILFCTWAWTEFHFQFSLARSAAGYSQMPSPSASFQFSLARSEMGNHEGKTDNGFSFQFSLARSDIRIHDTDIRIYGYNGFSFQFSLARSGKETERKNGWRYYSFQFSLARSVGLLVGWEKLEEYSFNSLLRDQLVDSFSHISSLPHFQFSLARSVEGCVIRYS